MALFDTIRAGSSGDTDFEIQRSLRFNPSDSARLSRTFSQAGNRKTFTFSAWVKRASFGSGHTIFACATDSSNLWAIYFPSEQFSIRSISGGSDQFEKNSSARFRDPTAWYHIVVAIDMTQSTAEDRAIGYINGERITDWATNTIPAQNTDLLLNSAEAHNIGRMGGLGNYWDGYIAEANFIDGQALTPASFAETDTVTGEYKPIDTSGLTFGTNGFRLQFADNSAASDTTLGKDTSGNGNNFSPTGLSVSAGEGNDSLEDTPTNNYPTLNPLDMGSTTASHLTYSNGNLQVKAASGVWAATRATFAVSSGKWYWEVKILSTATFRPFIGIIETQVRLASNQTEQSNELGPTSTGIAYWVGNPIVRGGTNTTGTSTNVPTCAVGDIVGVALDMDNKKVFFSKNGTFFASQDPANSSGELVSFSTTMQTATIAPAIQVYNNTSEPAMNFGQRAFDYTPPTGYEKLNSKNLPEPTITDGTKYFDTLLWTGTNLATTRDITGLEFSPDWVWIKARDRSVYGGGLEYHHLVWDTVRGAGSNSSSGAGKDLVISLNTSRGEGSQINVFSGFYGHVSSFNSNGFTVQKKLGEPPLYTDTSGVNYVGWCWDAGSSTVTNTDGSTSAQVRANTTAGFSICTWTGTGSNLTIGHGLGVKPAAHITTSRTGSSVGCDWFVYLSIFGAEKNLRFNNSSALGDAADLYNDTEPTSSVITIGDSSCINVSGGTYVTYVFAEVEGYSKFGKYTGNGNSNGTFVFTGFRPAWVMVKRTDSTNDWPITDRKRNTHNPLDTVLYADLTNSEHTSDRHDYCSNGFKVRNTFNESNGSGATYIYFAFAENPFKYARAR